MSGDQYEAKYQGRALAILLVAAVPLGFVLALDEARWPIFSLGSVLVALALTAIWRHVRSSNTEVIAAAAWVAAAIASARWLAEPIVAAPLVVITIVGLPIIISAELRRRRATLRNARGACMICGYDLRASQTRCPECGDRFDEDAERRRRVAEAIRAERDASAAAAAAAAPRSRSGRNESDVRLPPAPGGDE